MVYSYDSRPQMQQLARKNLKRLSLDQNVLLKTKDIGEGFDEIPHRCVLVHGVLGLRAGVPRGRYCSNGIEGMFDV